MQNKNRHHTKKGPGRLPFSRRKAGAPRLQAATGPDSINAKDVFVRLLDRGEIARAESFLAAMKTNRTWQPWMEIALSQHKALAA